MTNRLQTDHRLERSLKVAKWQAMLEWPSWDQVLDEASCNTAGVFSNLEPQTFYNGRCVTFDELEELLAEEIRKNEEEAERLAREEEEREQEEQHLRETEQLRQECVERGDIWLTPTEGDELAFGVDHERSVHGYCISLSPVLLQHMNLPTEKKRDVFLNEAHCFYEGLKSSYR